MFKFIAAVILSAAIATPAFAYTKAEQEAAYAAAGLKKHEGGKFTNECGREVTPVLSPVELGALGAGAAMLKIDDVGCYGNVGSRIVLFRREGNHLQVIFDNNAGDITVLKTSHMGVFDLELGGPGMDIPTWKWSGQKYEFWKSRTVELSKLTKAESVTKAPVAAGEPQKHYCGIVHDYADSDQIMDGKFNPYWDHIDFPPRDPKGLDSSPLLREGNCLCVDGAVKAFDRGGKRAYRFTDILGVKICDTKSVPH
jgi:hypothetical protein